MASCANRQQHASDPFMVTMQRGPIRARVVLIGSR